MNLLGRNDPCYCGSGKKYKKCHLEADQRQRGRAGQPQAEPPSASLSIKTLPKQLRQIWAKGGNEFAEARTMLEPLLEYLDRREEILAASLALESHRQEFEGLAADMPRCFALAQRVFEEECFVPLRFTAADVQRAFEKVGYPPTMSPDQRTAEILRAAILHVADSERRHQLVTCLLLRLPEFVAAGRYLEGWLIQCSAVQTSTEKNESNVFLFEMFSYGYDAWAAAKKARDISLLSELGLDPSRLERMSMEEIDSWIQAQASDPAKTKLLEAFFQDHPELREEAIGNSEALGRNSHRLLERPDTHFLHLSKDEVQPWLTLFCQRARERGLLSDEPDDTSSEEEVGELLETVAVPVMREMANSIFTRDRIVQLVADLKEYRRERFAAGDQTTAAHAMGAFESLEREDNPGENSFLLSLCWVSIRSLLNAMQAEVEAVANRR